VDKVGRVTVVDDNKDNSSADLWAGIDSEPSKDIPTVFSFSFDADPGPPSAVGLPAEPEAGKSPEMDLPTDGIDEAKLGVFSPEESEDDSLLQSSLLDAIESETKTQDDDEGESVAIDRQTADSSPKESSTIEIGTGHSGIVSNTEWSDDEWADAAVNSSHPPESPEGAPDAASESQGFGEGFGEGFGDFPDATGDAESPFAADPFEETSQGMNFNNADADATDTEGSWGQADSDVDQEPAFEDEAADEESTAVALGSAAPAATVAATIATAGAAKMSRKKPTARRAKQSGLGQMVGVVLGGVLALPITYAILIWGFQKDPFKFAKMVPAEVAFLLPEKFQPGYKKPVADRAVIGIGKSGSPSPLDNLSSLAASEEVIPEEVVKPAPVIDDLPSGAIQTPVAVDPVSQPAVQPALAPELLDLSQLLVAVQKASAASDELVAIEDPADPIRKRMLLEWYKILATVGEELVMLETAASDTGQPLKQTPPAVVELCSAIAADNGLAQDLQKLGRLWLASKKRTTNGVLLLADYGSSQKIGPYWCTKASLSSPTGEAHNLTILSRKEPIARVGDQVVAAGILFDGNIIWAADCRRFEK